MVPKTSDSNHTKMQADPTQATSEDAPANEATPLLGAPETVTKIIPASNGHLHNPEDPPATSDQEEEEKPMPVTQILLLCYASLAEPVAYFSIFPFINEMVFRLGHGMPESSVGFWTGAIESLFSVVQMVLMIFYGRAADRFGRKPVLVFSLAGVSVATAVFGLSRSLEGMVMARCFAGCFAGSVVTIRTMISENCTKRSQARAFSWYMFVRNLGIFIGPLIGGPLACPQNLDHAPAICKTTFLSTFPYSLACFVAAFVCLSGCLVCVFLLKETLDRSPNDPENPSSAPKGEMSVSEVLRSPGVPMVLAILALTNLLSMGYTAVSPVFMFTKISLGGLSFDDRLISAFLCVAGGSQALWMLIAFPPLQKRYGTGNVLRVCAAAWPLFMASYPIFNELRRHGAERWFWSTFFPSLAVASGVAMSFACVQLAINDIAPSSRVLGTVNSIALAVSSGVRAFAPVTFTSLFAIGVKSGWADGHLIWVVLTVLALGFTVLTWFLPKQAEGRYEEVGKGKVVVEEEGGTGRREP